MSVKTKLITQEEIYSTIQNGAMSDVNLDLAVAFWGENIPFIKLLKSKNCRIICNLQSGGTNPKVIEELMLSPDIEIRQNSNLHAKVYLGDSFVVIGSSNVSTNGIGYEGQEIKGWHEANVSTTDRHIIIQTEKWFNSIWKSIETNQISKNDIREAKKKWANRRKNRPLTTKRNIFEQPDFVKDKNYEIMWRIEGEPSESAKNLFNEIKSTRNYSEKISFYETSNWKTNKELYVFDFAKKDSNKRFEFTGLVKTFIPEKKLTTVKNNYIVLFEYQSNYSILSKHELTIIRQKMNELKDEMPESIDLYKFIKNYF